MTAAPARKPLSDPTRERLLYAAGEVFAEQGFRAATVREICRLAGVNAASVNYYFSSKEALYAEVLEFAHRQARSQFPYDVAGQSGVPAEQRLRTFVLSFMQRLLAEGRTAWLGKLMAREMVEPTAALEGVVKSVIRPQHEHLEAILREIAGPDRNEEEVVRCAFSIIGQCLFYRHCRPVIAALEPAEGYDAAGIERAASHIADFSLKAMGRMPECITPR